MTGNAGAWMSLACWGLVLFGVAGTFLAGRGVSWGWLLLASLQPLWISYAVLTGQYGFIVGAVAYGAAQMNGFLRSRRVGRTGRSRGR